MATRAIILSHAVQHLDRAERRQRWIAEIQELPGVMIYGATREEAQTRVKALALRVLGSD